MEQSYIALHDSFVEAVDELKDSYARMQKNLVVSSVRAGQPISEEVITKFNVATYETIVS